jgi:3-methyladenine DNA glycosylase Tag
MSPRTAKYVEAMIREGDNFDYNEWLKEVRQEEAQAKQEQAAITRRAVAATQVNNPISASDFRDRRPFTRRALIGNPGLNSRALRRLHHQPKSQTPKARLRRWFNKLRLSWDNFQASRARDAVYDYLEAVFAIVMHYKVRRRTNRLLRHVFEFANLPLNNNNNTDPFSAVLRCTCGDAADSKTISKWSRALRCGQYFKKPRTPVKKFMKASGGINTCAARYAKLMRRV